VVTANHLADIIITQAGEYNPYDRCSSNPKLFVVRWNGTRFETRSIDLHSALFPGAFEHITFAPIQLPNLPQ